MQLYTCAGTILCNHAFVPLYMHNCTHLCSCTVMQSCACTLVLALLRNRIPLCSRALVLAQLHTLLHACSCAFVRLYVRAFVLALSCAVVRLCTCAVAHALNYAVMRLCSCMLVQMMLMESIACSRRHRYEPYCSHHGLRASRNPVPDACASSRCPVHECSGCQS